MKFWSVFMFLFIHALSFGQTFETKTYEKSEEMIANPERGFYHHTEVNSSNYVNLNLSNLISYREDESIIQILRVFYLNDFLNKPISQDYLDNMHSDFNIVREAGLKVIVRFAYTKSSSKPYNDATPNTVRDHIHQLKEVFAQHKDVISVIQTGFVGAWGEWYYTDHFAGANPWIITDENWVDRADLVDNLLDVIPKDRMIQLRTPGYKMKIFDTEESIDISDAYNQTKISRVGHHNDCFVASSSDFGTYVNPELEKPYLENETTFLPMGGETCALAPPYSDCENAYSELQRFHWSYLNIDYNKIVLDTWKDQGCFDDVERNLGYRYVLQEATVKTEVHPEGKFELTFNLNNEGFANPYNPRGLEIVLQSISQPSKIYKLITDENPGLWPIQEDFEVTIEGGFSDNLEQGEYNVFLSFPDSSPSLKNDPNYSIRLANQDIWQVDEGWNKLELPITISTDFSSDSYTGDKYFVLINQPLDEVEGPNKLYYGGNPSGTILFWSKTTDFEFRSIQESSDGVDFSTISTITADHESYKLTSNFEDLYYRFILFNENEQVISNDIQVLNINDDDAINIVTDGLDQDWGDLIPTATASNADHDSYILRTYFSIDQVHFSLYGAPTNYKIYLDTDNDISTGYNTSILAGMDYLIDNQQLYEYDGSDWSLVSSEIIENVDNIIELNLDLALFENLNSNSLIPIVAYLNDDSVLLSLDATSPAKHVRNLPPDLPTNFEVTNSVPFPHERLEIHWEECVYCDGYILEKSDDGIDFEFLTDLDQDEEVFYHDFLPNGIHYYRILSYNSLGKSDFSDVESGVLGTTNTQLVEKVEDIDLWPNPTNGVVNMNVQYESLGIYDMLGRLVKEVTPKSNVINISELESGSYLFILELQDKTYKSIIIKE